MTIESSLSDIAVALARIATAMETPQASNIKLPAGKPPATASTPPAPAPIPEPAPAPIPEPAAANEINLSHIMEYGTRVLETPDGKACLKKIAADYDVAKISVVDPKHYPAIMKAFKAHLGEAA